MYLKEGINGSFIECDRCGETYHEDFIYPDGYCDTCHDDMN